MEQKSGMTWLFKQKEEAPTTISENHQKPENFKKRKKILKK